MLLTKRVKAGKWRTLETLWNAGATVFFRAPAGAKIKVRYGVGWLGKDRQEQTLDAQTFKRLSVGAWSVTRARIQIKVKASADVTYDYVPGGVALSSPEISF